MSGQGGYNYIQKNYLTIEALEDGLQVKLSGIACEYCVNGNGSWVSLAKSAQTPAIKKGQTLSFRANYTSMSYSGVGRFNITKTCNLLGNIMSIRYGDNAPNTKSTGVNYAFYEAFTGQPIVSVAEDFLPATTLSSDCYSYMFMNCSRLTSAPKLPATTLAKYCYSTMFKGCTSLTAAPELPATTLLHRSYYCMFDGCSSLKYVKALFTTTPDTNYTGNWLNGVASSGTFVKSKSAKWTTVGVNGVPSGWTIVKE